MTGWWCWARGTGRAIEFLLKNVFSYRMCSGRGTQVELKAKIEAFLASKRLEMSNTSMGSAGDTSMDAA